MVFAIPMIYHSYNPSSKLFSFKTMFQKPFEPQDTTDSKPKALELFCLEHILLYRVHQRIQKLQTQVLTTFEILTYIFDTFPDIYVWYWMHL